MRTNLPLNFDWLYRPDFSPEYLLKTASNEGFERVMLPHTNIEVPYNHFDEKMSQFVSSYKKSFTVPIEAKGHRIYLQFLGVMTTAEVYLNGQALPIHEGGYTPFSFDISELVNFEEPNELFVKVDSHEIKDVPPFGNVVDYLPYGGIYREVNLLIRPKNHIRKLFIKTFESPKLSPTEMNLDFTVLLTDPAQHVYRVEWELKHHDTIIFEESFSKEKAEMIHRNLTIENVARWSVEEPNLYHLSVKIYADEVFVDQITDRFGFRSMAFTEEGFVLNNRKLKLIGLNRHQSYPYVGYAMPKRMQEHDAELLKWELGCNIVRTSHYMQSDHFIARCDEIGLLVFEEIPGWQYIGNDHFKELSYQNVSDMVTHHYNHPSIVLWGVRINESSDDHDFYHKTNEIAHKLDDSRQTGGVRNFAKSELQEDVYTYNDFSHVGNNLGLLNPKSVTKQPVPYLVTEHNGHIFPTKKFDTEQKRLEQAYRHLAVLDSAFGYEQASGAIGWCMADYNTHVEFGSGDRICYHGVTDMFRIPKHAAYVYASQQTLKPILHVASNLTMGEYSRAVIPPTVIFTNCDYVKVYRNDHFIGTFYSDWETYEAIPFAPVIIDDYLGDRILESGEFKPKVAARIKKVLIAYNKYGFDMPWSDKFRMFVLLTFNGLKMGDAFRIFGNYVGDWGKEGAHYRYEGYHNDTLVATVQKGATHQAILEAKIDTSLLKHGDTYDVTRIVVQKVDEFGNNLPYASDAFTVSTTDGLEIIGPKTLSLIGGSIGIYVKTTGILGKATVTIQNETDRIQLEVTIE